MKCPKCSRDTYSKKWGSCTACGLNADRTPEQIRVTPAKPVTSVMGRADVVTSVAAPRGADVTYVSIEVKPGDKCPTCDETKPPTMESHICDEECQAEEHRNISRILNIKPEPGEDCALCERKVPSKNAQRQAAYRGRKE